MKLVVPTEIYDGETRVGITPDCVPSLVKMGFKVCVQKNAGIRANYTDEDYKKSGASISPTVKDLYNKADIVIKIQRPTKHSNINEFNLVQNCNLLTLMYEQKFKTEFSNLKKKKN